jgi:ubiquinone/menaquinone biosynthesis C-methylase UbiE
MVQMPEQFKLTDAYSYDSVTPEFDRFTERFTTALAARLVSFADVSVGEHVLDIGTGTGIVALKAARKVGTTGRVTGIDLSDGMLAAAQAKSIQVGLGGRIDFRKMDAEQLAFTDRSFDSVLSLFALLHFPNPGDALREMFRVLRPGGKLVVAVGSSPPLISVRGVVHRMKMLNETLAQVHGKSLIGPAYLEGLVKKYIPADNQPEESALARTHQNLSRAVPQLISAAGFLNVRHHWEGQQRVLETADEFWDLQRTFSSFARKRLLRAPQMVIDALKSEFLRTCTDVQSRGGRLIYPQAAFYVMARRPTV